MSDYLSNNLSKTQRVWPARLLPTVALTACLVLLALSLFSGADVPLARPQGVVTMSTAEVSGRQQETSEMRRDAPRQLQGAQARAYLAQTSDGQSLMQAVTIARFGLKWQERAPFGEATGGGYLGMSHDQNLNAWFDEAGATVRPTVPETERSTAWQLGLRLKSYGYGDEMQAVPPIVSHQVKENRIEYVRANCQLPIANCRFENTAIADLALGSAQSQFEALSRKQSVSNELPIFHSAIGNRQSAMTEWYENRREGIEQGFTIQSRPGRSVEIGANEPLRPSLQVSGELSARVKDEGQTLELVDKKGSGAVSYGKLVAQDADRKQLAARMEASADGREIVLVVEDAGARYPIVIDPIVIDPIVATWNRNWMQEVLVKQGQNSAMP